MLSICIPATSSRLTQLSALRASLAVQTCQDYEVVLAWDGEDPPEHERGIRVERTVPHLAHRNHARNAAAAASSGDLLFFCDVDFVFEPNFVKHVLAVKDQCPAYSPVMAQKDRNGVLRPLFAGYSEQYRRGKPPLLKEPPEYILEGMPVVRRDLFEALGGFDERFLGWGSNKVEFVHRVRQVVPYQLLCSTRIIHQWHPPTSNEDHAVAKANHSLLQAIQEEIAGGAPWWIQQRDRVQTAMSHIYTQPCDPRSENSNP